MSAMTLDSGSYPHVRRTSRTNDNDRTHETPRPSHWLSAGAIGLTGFGLLAVTAILVLLYLLATTAGAVGPGRALLLGATVSTSSVAGIALIAAWTLRVLDAQQVHHRAELRAELDQTATAMACTAVKLRVALAELPDQVRDRARMDAAAYMAVANGIERQTMNIGRAVQALAEQVEGRMVAVEQRADGVEETMAQVATAEAIMSRVDGGTVVPMRPNGMPHGR